MITNAGFSSSSNQKIHGLHRDSPKCLVEAQAPLTPPRWRRDSAGVSSLDCTTSTTNETNSTATISSDRSKQHDSSHDTLLLESAMMRTRTNFGDYQYYVPPETKASPYSVPNGAPVTPTRDRGDPTTNARRPLDRKKLQFFDDDVASDQIPFDQVWNQQEFTLDQEETNTPSSLVKNESQAVKNGNLKKDVELSLSLSAASDDLSQPFDEAPEKLEVSGSSAFSAFSAANSALGSVPAPPPPPPPLAQNDGTFKPSSSHTSRSPARDPPGVLHNPASAGDNDIPFDEDENSIPSDEEDDNTKRRKRRQKRQQRQQEKDSQEKQNLSLATASRRKTAEDLSPTKSAEDLGTTSNSKKESKRKKKNRYNDSDDEEGESSNDTGNGKVNVKEDDDNSLDSLFDFQDQQPVSSKSPVRAPSPSPDRWRKQTSAKSTLDHDDDDETSVEDNLENGNMPCLKTRAQEAFASRRKKNVSPKPSPQRKLVTPTPPAATTTTTTPSRSKAQVSFTKTNTIHHFELDYDPYSDQDESALSNGSFDNDTNDKTIGNDVEEALRDIFMINALGACNPSSTTTQETRFHYDTRNERRDLDNSDDDDDELQSDDEPDTSRTAATRSSAASTQEQLENLDNSTNDVFFETMLSMVEGGIGAMSAVLGLTPSRSNDETTEAETDQNDQLPVNITTPRTSPPESPPIKLSSRSLQRWDSGNSSMGDYSLGLGKSESFEEDTAPETLQDLPYEELVEDFPEDEKVEKVEQVEKEVQSLEDDPHLLELAKQAALCMHEVLGVQYDESQDVDISDIKFVVVELSLPLGIIFQEDYSGCWIAKIMPQGNAHLCGKIVPGDQLAAINEKSAIGMKVDDICEAISAAASESSEIELTFLRYIGPFQPVSSASDPSSRLEVKQVAEDNESITYSLQDDQLEVGEDEKPRSTRSINSTISNDRKPTKKAKPAQASPKRGKKMLKWFGRGKKNATKAE